MEIRYPATEPVTNVYKVPYGSIIEFVSYESQYIYTLLVTQYKEEDKFVRCVDVRDGEIVDVPWDNMITYYAKAELYLGEVVKGDLKYGNKNER